MQTEELHRRIYEVLAKRREGFYVDALELEAELWRDVAETAVNAAWESLHVGGPTATLVHEARLTYRELKPAMPTV